jgi:16S rRNA (guanine(966)-N(2))-methyltransferase RsmD
MRIIAGTFRSRALDAPSGLATRPTSDRLRETLFNVLAPRIEGASFLDLYAGLGAVGIEALSRGAMQVTFVEQAPDRLKIAAGFRIHAGSVASFLRKPRAGAVGRAAEVNLDAGFSIVFLDPPYDAAEEYAAALGQFGSFSTGLLATGAVVIAEHRRKQRLEPQYGALERTRLLEQGDVALSFYAAKTVSEPE